MKIQSKDLCLIIMLSVVHFTYVLFIGQLGSLLTGVPGLDYFFSAGHAIFISYALLAFEGRRWRFFIYASLFSILASTTYFAGGVPFDFIRRTPLIINCFFADLIFNSLYIYFEKRNKKYWWSAIATFKVIVFSPFYHIFILTLFYSPESVNLFTKVVLSIFPVFIAEALIGAYVGINIYKRTKKILIFD